MMAPGEENSGGSATEGTPILEIHGLKVEFPGGIVGLERADLSLLSGEVHALVGHNGAGKSTMIKALAGVYPVAEGEVRFHGKQPDVWRSLPKGLTSPFAFIHQDLGLIEDLSVAENISLEAGFVRRRGLIQWSKTTKRAREVLSLVGLRIDPSVLVSDLPVGQRALVAIARALVLDAEVIVFDEPTAALAQPDVERLFDAIRRLRDHGVGVIYVTHRLSEVVELSDRVTVLREGRTVATESVSKLQARDILKLMLGRDHDVLDTSSPPSSGEVVLRVRKLVGSVLDGMSLDVHKGEILGMAGLQGAGTEEFGRMLYGEKPVLSGDLVLRDRPYSPLNVRDALERGVGYLSADRLSEGGIPEFNLRENLFLAPMGRVGDGHRVPFLHPRRERVEARRTLEEFGVHPPNPDRHLTTLSGGNIQKVLLARVLLSSPNLYLLVLEEPTQGLDVEARAWIHRFLGRMAIEGCAIIIISSDFEELADNCGRVTVMHDGKIVADLHGEEVTHDRIAHEALVGRG